MQRWTDGRRWSCSRVMGEFLAYDEVRFSTEDSPLDKGRCSFDADRSPSDFDTFRSCLAEALPVEGQSALPVVAHLDHCRRVLTHVQPLRSLFRSSGAQTCRLENGLIKQSFALTLSCVITSLVGHMGTRLTLPLASPRPFSADTAIPKKYREWSLRSSTPHAAG
jgi:hypothetical protein